MPPDRVPGWTWLAVGSALVLIASPAASDPYAIQIGKLEAFVANEPVGSEDVWLMTLNAMGEYEKVALMFGMASDMAFCWSLVDAYREKYPNMRLICLPANSVNK